MTRTRTGKGGSNTSAGGNTSGQSGESAEAPVSTGVTAGVTAAIKAAVALVKPEQCYISNGGMRLLEFTGGVAVDLHDKTPAIVVMVLSREQAQALPAGLVDHTEL